MALDQEDIKTIRAIAEHAARTRRGWFTVSIKFVVNIAVTVAVCWTVLTQTNLTQWQSKFFVNGIEVTQQQFESLTK